MRIEVLQENLSAGLSLVSRIVSSHPQIPALGNILLVAGNGELVLTASDGEVTIQTKTGAKVLVEGSVCISTRTFVELINSLTSGKIELSLDENNLLVNNGKFRGKVNVSAASDYPKISWEKTDLLWSLSAEVLQKSVSCLVYATATDESRPALTGVLLRSRNGEVEMAATDAFRLSVVRLKTSLPTEVNLIIPSRVLQEVLRAMSESKTKTVEVSLLQGEIVFYLGETQIHSRLISSNYPNFEKIIPSSSSIKLLLSTDSFSRAIKTAAIIARGNSNIVRLKVNTTGQIFLAATAAQVGEEEQQVDGALEGKIEEDFSIAFNFKYLQDYLNSVVGTGEVQLEMNNALSPTIFRLPGNEEYLHIIMPVRV